MLTSLSLIWWRFVWFANTLSYINKLFVYIAIQTWALQKMFLAYGLSLFCFLPLQIYRWFWETRRPVWWRHVRGKNIQKWFEKGFRRKNKDTIRPVRNNNIRRWILIKQYRRVRKQWPIRKGKKCWVHKDLNIDWNLWFSKVYVYIDLWTVVSFLHS